jgi:hypothetical protein
LKLVSSRTGLVRAFNDGLFWHANGEWEKCNLDAFHDLLSWPEDNRYRLVLDGWSTCIARLADERTWDGRPLMEVLREIIDDNSHIEAVYA